MSKLLSYTKNKCKICNNTYLSSINDNNLKKIYLYCNNCEYISLDKNYIVSNNLEKKRYLLHNNNPENEDYVNYLCKIINNIPINTKHQKILDFGCGSAPVLAKLLKERNLYVDVYDKFFSPKKIYYFKKYNIITCIEVLEHLKNPLKSFKLFKKHLKKEGMLVCMTNFHPNDINLFLKWWYKNDITHISFYSKKTIEFISKFLNFKIIKIINNNFFIMQK